MVLDAINMDKFADLLETEFGLAAAQERSNLSTGRKLFDFSLDLLTNPQPIKKLRQVAPARA